MLTDAASAELVKYAANCFLAMKLSYVNAVAELCDRLGADINHVTEGMGYDRRIGQAFLAPGPGWGGSCLLKDTAAMPQLADAADFEFRLIRATIDTNPRQRQRMVEKVRLAVTSARNGSLSRTRLGLLGLTFKAGTDDLRDSPPSPSPRSCAKPAPPWSATTPPYPAATRSTGSSSRPTPTKPRLARRRSSCSLNATRQRADAVFDAIPFGQPMMPGHHSYKADRNRRERASANLRKSFEQADVAAELARQAESAGHHMGARYNPVTVGNRIAKLEADRRAVQRQLDGDGALETYTGEHGHIGYRSVVRKPASNATKPRSPPD